MFVFAFVNIVIFKFLVEVFYLGFNRNFTYAICQAPNL